MELSLNVVMGFTSTLRSVNLMQCAVDGGTDASTATILHCQPQHSNLLLSAVASENKRPWSNHLDWQTGSAGR